LSRPGEESRGPLPRFPLWLKLAHTAFLCVLVPFYWRTYGPVNFLYFCDLALFLTLAALWLDSPLLASMPALLILLPQALWLADFLCGLLGFFPVGVTRYMFDPGIPLFARGLSLFHGWLPLLLVWMLWRAGYDRRALLPQVALTWAVLLACLLFRPRPPAPADNPNAAVNVNYVFAFPWDESKPQEVMPPAAWVGLLGAFYTLAILLPTHVLLGRLFGRRRAAREAGQAPCPSRTSFRAWLAGGSTPLKGVTRHSQ
jgi:hypothetical protein